jgi:hypothetical protein
MVTTGASYSDEMHIIRLWARGFKGGGRTPPAAGRIPLADEEHLHKVFGVLGLTVKTEQSELPDDTLRPAKPLIALL